MFTGIVEELGRIKAIEVLPDALRVTIEGPLVASDVNRGDSISVSGTCLTAVEHDGTSFTADVMQETLNLTSLDGIKVVVDCAHGAAAGVSPQVFTDAGAKVIAIGADPDGNNINLGYGSTHMSALQSAVLEHGADFGIAHDGDADRCLAVDANGAIIDGDQIMAILALSLKERGQLARNTLVATVMSNLGLRIAMKENGIEMIETAVGDRYVLEEMRAGGYTLGGEQSGHVIFAQYATTGDGILTGLKIGAEMARTKKSLAELATVMKIYPQVLINVPGVDKTKVDSDAELQKVVAEAEADLHGTGRVLLRASGTEPLVRVMVEAAEAGTAQSWAERIARVVEKQLAL